MSDKKKNRLDIQRDRILSRLISEDEKISTEPTTYTPIILTLDKGTRELQLILKVLEPKEDHPFNYSKFYPTFGNTKYVITVGKKDFSDFFQRLNFYANSNNIIGDPVKGLTLFRDISAGFLCDIIYHLYGYSCWGEGRTVQEYER